MEQQNHSIQENLQPGATASGAPSTALDTAAKIPIAAKVGFIALTLLLIGTVLYLLRGVIHPILLGIFFAIIMSPLHKRLRGQMMRIPLFRKREEWGKKTAAFLSVFLLFLVITVPFSLALTYLGKEGIKQISTVEKWFKTNQLPQEIQEFRNKTGYGTRKISSRIWDFLDKQASRIQVDENAADSSPTLVTPILEEEEKPANETFEKIKAARIEQNQKNQNLVVLLQKTGRWATNKLRKSWDKIISGTAVSLFHYFIMYFVMFFILLDGDKFKGFINTHSPLDKSTQQRVVGRIKKTSRGIFIGILAMAAVQGILASILFLCLGVPAFYGLFLGVSALIPIVGTGLVWVPVCVYLYFIGRGWAALICFLICGGIISNMDFFLRPFLIKKAGKTGLSYCVLFFSLLGGLQTFGLIGLIYGPIIMALCALCLAIYQEQQKNLPPAKSEDDAEDDVEDEFKG